jgi:hypothetical protein
VLYVLEALCYCESLVSNVRGGLIVVEASKIRLKELSNTCSDIHNVKGVLGIYRASIVDIIDTHTCIFCSLVESRSGITHKLPCA